MPCTAKKTFASAARTGNALLVRLKGNQPGLHEAVAGLSAGQDPVDRHETADRGWHGRQEHRRVEVFAVADQLPPEWRGTIACAARVSRLSWCKDTRAGLWRPGRLARHLNARTVLVLGTVLSAGGYALAGLSGGLAGLAASLVLAGAGGSTQHPLASAAVSRAYGAAARGPLGTYNFAGDLGKAALPPAVSLLLTVTDWHKTLWAVDGLGVVVAFLIGWLMPPVPTPPTTAGPADAPARGAGGKGGFGLLLAIGVMDSAVRMAFLLLLPFLLQAKGASLTTVGLALSLVFVGGAVGKAACGWLGARLGLVATVIATELGTAAAISAVLVLPLAPGLALLPPLGAMLNGTSSVLYGTVPELVAAGRIEHAFALFYTGVLGSSALAPVLYGRLGDAAGPVWATGAAAVTALGVVPLVLWLAPRLRPSSGARGS